MELLPEVEVWYALPAIRRRLAFELKERGLTQKAVAERLGIAESAVSQYLSGKRGASELPERLDAEFASSAQAISEDASLVAKEILRLSELLKTSRAICDLHRQHSDVPSKCTQCFD